MADAADANNEGQKIHVVVATRPFSTSELTKKRRLLK